MAVFAIAQRVILAYLKYLEIEPRWPSHRSVEERDMTVTMIEGEGSHDAGAFL